MYGCFPTTHPQTQAAGWTSPLLYPGSACAVKTINCCHEYPKKRGCAVMAFTAEEVISMLNDTYEDNSDDDQVNQLP